MSDCVFCKIVAGEFNTDFVAESEYCVAFRDIKPEMPVHILVVPREHLKDVTALVSASQEALVDLVSLSSKIAADHAEDGSFKLLFNTGEAAGQTVFHAHAHILSQVPKSA